MEAARVDWSMGSRAAWLVDWRTAADVGRRIGGAGISLPAVDRARMREDLSELVPLSESLVEGFTGMHADGFRSRAWVMSRGEWVGANLKGLQRLLEPLAERLARQLGNRGDLRRKALGAQVGVVLGYVSRKVLGQFDAFLPPDDEGVLYFVGPNVAETERRFALPARDFRFWIAMHEVTHRVQFSGTPWLRGYLSQLVDDYLGTVELDTSRLIEQLKRAVEEARTGGRWRSSGTLLLLMTPEQRDLFRKMQAMMSLLEGHASYVMNSVAVGRVRDLERMRRSLAARRRSGGVEKAFQRAIGFESKIRQYDAGEFFVSSVVEKVGMQGFNLVWEQAANLPLIEEVADPARWLVRVAGG